MKFRNSLLSFFLFLNVLLSAQYSSVLFNGTNQYLEVPHNSVLCPTSQITVECWASMVNWSSVSGYTAIVSKTEFGGYEFAGYANGAGLAFWVHRNGGYGTPFVLASALTPGWHHFAGTFDGRYAKLYVDGVLINTDDAANSYPIDYAYNNSLIIGAEAGSGTSPYSAGYFPGKVRDVRVWNKARTQTEISTNMITLTGTTGLLGWWKMNEGAGSTVLDYSGYNWTGALFNNPTWQSDVALPVELTSFAAKATKNFITLNWQTATELQNYGFEIERALIANSSNIEANLNWKKSGFVKGNGTSSQKHDYSFLDKPSTGGNYKYRLKQLDIDGNYKYSNTINVKFDGPSNFALEQNYPNPFNPSTQISYSIPTASFVSLKIYDINGNEIQSLVKEQKEAGSYSITWNGTSLSGEKVASGIYFYKLSAGEQVVVKKMQLMK